MLLFSCNTAGGKIIRTYTGSVYGKSALIDDYLDHAGMVLKFEEHPNDVFFLEATSNNGVCLRRWSNIKKEIGRFYRKITIRHIDWERTEESLVNLEAFMREVVGSAYSFSFKQLFKRQTQIVRKGQADPFEKVEPRQKSSTIVDATTSESELEEKVRLVEEGRAFFCSELVAKCWKVCGLMKPTDEACSNFLPYNFTTEKQTINLIDAIKWEHEALIFGF